MPRWPHLFLGLILSGAVSSAHGQARASQRCDISSKSVCSAEGCKLVEPTTYAMISTTARTYARCDRMGCDTYPAEFTASGIFTTIEVPGRGVLARFSEAGGFVELVTLGLTAYVSHGQCRG